MSLPAFIAVIQAACDYYWENVICVQQEAFKALHGYYFQGLPTHSVAPADGVFVAPDQLTAHPHDQPQDWLDVPGGFPLAETTASLRCDVYQSANGWGHMATFEVRETASGKTYRCVKHYGPEARATHDFEEVAERVLP